MFNVKNIKLKKIGMNKNKLNTLKSENKNVISNKLSKNTKFHRSLEAFSDCV